MSPVRARLALLIGATAFALSALGAQAASPPPLYVTYDANSNLSVSVAGGAPLGSSSAIPPGPYWVTFDNEFSSERIVRKWHLVGPGVDVSTVGGRSELRQLDRAIRRQCCSRAPPTRFRTTSIRLSGRWSSARPPRDRVRPARSAGSVVREVRTEREELGHRRLGGLAVPRVARGGRQRGPEGEPHAQRQAGLVDLAEGRPLHDHGRRLEVRRPGSR